MNYENWYEDAFGEEYEDNDDFEEEKNLFDDDDEFRCYGREAIESIKKRNDSDYELNQHQYARFVAVCAYFTKLAKKSGGKASKVKIEPRMEAQSVETTFKSIHLEGEELKHFIKAISMCCTVEFNPNLDGKTEFGVVVPEAFHRKAVNQFKKSD